MITVNDLIENLVGKSFEINCSNMEVHGMRDNHSPLYKGPGVILGGKSGPVAFRLHNQIEMTEEALQSLRSLDDGEPLHQVRVFAEDYNGIKWVGGWAIPNIEPSRTPRFMVNGEFSQLNADVEKQPGDQKRDHTEIVYGERLDLPMTELVEEQRRRGEEIVYAKAWSDRHKLNFNGALISFFENSAGNRTHVIAEHKGGVTPTLGEVWLAEAIAFILGRQIYPRMYIRHLEKDALVFLRTTNPDTRSAMPPPIIGPPSSLRLLWDLYSAYLGECIRRGKFGSMELTDILAEVVFASTGTTQAFALSLSVCVENLVGQLADQLNIEVPDKDVVNELSSHVKNWSGDEAVKNRALGLLSMLRTKSASSGLNILKEEGVIEDKHIKAWKSIRNTLAHGGVIEYPISQDLWEQRNTLISMVYRLVLRIIGYKGQVTEHSNGTLVNFNWSQKMQKNADKTNT